MIDMEQCVTHIFALQKKSKIRALQDQAHSNSQPRSSDL